MAIPLNDNVATRSNKPTDSRFMDFAGGISTPYASIAAAKSAIDPFYRYQYLTIWAKAPNGDPLEYWWRVDTTDASLEPKNKESYTLNSDGALNMIPGYNYTSVVVIPTNNLPNLKIGLTDGGGEIEPGAIVTAGTAYNLTGSLGLYTINTALFFGNIAAGTKIILYKTF